MSIDVENNLGLKGLVKEIEGVIEKELDIVVGDEVTKMVLRTTSGRDVDNRTFRKYSEQYRRFKSGRGRGKNIKKVGSGRILSRQKSSQVDPPDLQFTGQMLASIRHRILRRTNIKTALVSFINREAARKAEGNIGRRRFFGFSKKQRDRIFNRLSDRITRAL